MDLRGHDAGPHGSAFHPPSGDERAIIGALKRGVDWLIPPTAIDTFGSVQSPGLTPASFGAMTFLDAPVCDGCGAPFVNDQGLGARCSTCIASPRAFDRARAACVYDHASRELILRFKHGDKPELGSLFARWMMRAGEELLAGADAVAPTPLHPRRLFGRRYNQAAEIARPLARLAKLRYAPDVLRRARPTPSQGGRSAVERRRNLVGAIVVDPARQPLVEGRRIVVIDDVFTTGATAEACAKALLRAGARAVDLLTVARVRDDATLTI